MKVVPTKALMTHRVEVGDWRILKDIRSKPG
jgi:hypothetical protein